MVLRVVEVGVADAVAALERHELRRDELHPPHADPFVEIRYLMGDGVDLPRGRFGQIVGLAPIDGRLRVRDFSS